MSAPGAGRGCSDGTSAAVRHQWRDASAASTAPAALTSTSSTEDTRSSRSTYCAASTRTEQPAPSARIRGTDASAVNRIGAKNPSAAKISRFPPIPSGPIVSRSRSGTRLTRPGTMPAPEPGIMVIHTNGTVP
jgi:hypothetical protein